MKWLRYVVIALVIIILLVFFVAPFSLGWWTKSQLPKWVSQFNQNNPGVTVALDNYHRGFFHSTGNLHISVADLNIQQALGLSDKHDTVDVDLAITQGPIVMTRIPGKGMSLFWTPVLIQSSTDSQSLTLHAVSQLALSDRLVSTIDIPHWATRINGMQCEIKGAKGDTRFFLIKKKGQSHWDVSSISIAIADPMMSLSLSGLSLDNQFNQPQSVTYGVRRIAADSLSFQEDKEQWELKGIALGSEISPAAKTTKIDLSAAFGSMVDQSGVSGGPLKATFSIYQLQTSLLSALYDKINHLPMDDVSSVAVQQHSQALLTPLIQLVDGGLMSQLDIHYQSQFGPVSSEASINVPPGQGKPMSFIVASTAQSTIKMPDAWLHQSLALGRQLFSTPIPKKEADQFAMRVIDAWKANKMIIQHGDQLLMALNLKQGQLTINDVPPNFNVPAPVKDVVSPDHSASSGNAHPAVPEPQTATSH